MCVAFHVSSCLISLKPRSLSSVAKCIGLVHEAGPEKEVEMVTIEMKDLDAGWSLLLFA